MSSKPQARQRQDLETKHRIGKNHPDSWGERHTRSNNQVANSGLGQGMGLRDRIEQARRRDLERQQSMQNAGDFFSRAAAHIADTVRVARGECPVCLCQVAAQQQSQRALVECDCGHRVTLEQWQRQNS